jgi:hypothetical protein
VKILIVGGNFDSLSGSPSKIISKIYAAFEYQIVEQHIDYEFVEIINGGTIYDLLNVNFKNYDVLLWAPNISNDEEKIIPNIKSVNPRLTLISTKRVVEKHYKESDVIGRLLKSKSNLGIMITKDDLYNFKLLDPLGNCYADTTDIEELSSTILQRIVFVKSLNRVGSVQVGEKRDVRVDEGFLEFVRHSASEFTKHVNAVNPNRLLGNASTRCMFGFPAEKRKERIFVTQRNIDKELIENNGFVEVTNREDVVEYYGEKSHRLIHPFKFDCSITTIILITWYMDMYMWIVKNLQTTRFPVAL